MAPLELELVLELTDPRLLLGCPIGVVGEELAALGLGEPALLDFGLHQREDRLVL